MIVAFSGTGNSFRVALLLSEFLGDNNVVRLEGEPLIVDKPVLSLNGKEEIIWVFPVYSWGIPPIMRKYISRCSVCGNKSVLNHLVVTCGDDIGDMLKQWNRLIASKCWQRGGAWSVQMPNTYTLMKGFDIDSPTVEKRKLSECRDRVRSICSRLQDRNYEDDVLKGSWPQIKTKIINPWFVRFDMSPKPFWTRNNCISCGLCEEQCPTMNISMKPDNDLSARPVWDGNCALCLRCYHNCPVNAIQYGKATARKGQYKFSQSLGEL